MTGSRFFVVSTFLAFLTATLLGIWTIQNLHFRQYVSQVADDLRVINSATRDATDSMSTDARILSLRTQLARLNAQLDRQTRTRAGLVDQARAATDASVVGEILEELGAVIRQSQETQAAAQDALLDLTDQYAIKIHALEQRTGGGGFDFWAVWWRSSAFSAPSRRWRSAGARTPAKPPTPAAGRGLAHPRLRRQRFPPSASGEDPLHNSAGSHAPDACARPALEGKPAAAVVSASGFQWRWADRIIGLSEKKAHKPCRFHARVEFAPDHLPAGFTHAST